tara:strand:+ start:58 stop:435 length:378 start_codon:yes stop_codon:yes gene_type:complete
MKFVQKSHHQIAHVADTYKELLQVPFGARNACLTGLIITNKIESSTNISVKIQHIDIVDESTAVDLEMIKTIGLATTATLNLINDVATTSTLGTSELHLPPGAKLFIKSSVLNAINVIATMKYYE